jgi:predicted ATP-binding protein involved in virulence
MRIDSLKIKNYRCFEDLEVSFDSGYNLHTIIAPNMVGKSALLKAIRIAASSYLRKIVPQGNTSISPEEHRVIGTNPFSDIARECSIQPVATMNIFNGSEWVTDQFEWRVYRENNANTKYEFISGNDLDRSIKRTYDRVVEKKENSLPLFLYVGTEYIHQPHAKTETLKEDGSAIQGYWYCFEEKSMESYVFDWLKRMYETSLEQDKLENAEILYEDLPQLFLNSFEQIVKSIFPDEIKSVQWIKNFKRSKTRPRKEGEKSQLKTKEDYILTFGFESGEVRTYNMLSDGYRYLILLAGELITRCVLLNKHLKTEIAIRTNGIVLIDEFGIHLHPELQMSALQRLCKAFPNVQFIITTHSPLLLNGLKKEQVHILEVDEKKNRSIRTSAFDIIGLGAEGILKDLFGLLSTLDDTSRQWAGDYKNLFTKKENQGLTPAESDEFRDLENKLLSVDPGITIQTSADPLYEKFKDRLVQFEFYAAANEVTLSDEQIDSIIKDVINKELNAEG